MVGTDVPLFPMSSRGSRCPLLSFQNCRFACTHMPFRSYSDSCNLTFFSLSSTLSQTFHPEGLGTRKMRAHL